MTESKKTDNHDPSAKLLLRRYLMRKYHGNGNARVLDCCMATGFIWREIRKGFPVAEYMGLDLKPKKGRLQIDSARYLEAGGWDHDVIDIDTYGAPWKHWSQVLRHAPGPVTVFLTIGFIRMGGGGALMTEAISAMGLQSLNVPKGILGALNKISVSYCLSECYAYGMIPVEAVEATSTGNARYIGVRLERKGMK
jgi:hypothetical protein